MEEMYGIAAFRSRQQVMQMESALRHMGIPAQVVTTPRAVALGCGLSVRFSLSDQTDVQETFRRTKVGNLIGFYQVAAAENGRLSVRRLDG